MFTCFYHFVKPFLQNRFSFICFVYHSHSFTQSLLFCPQNLQTTFPEKFKSVCSIFSVHRILIWLACWVARAAFIVIVFYEKLRQTLVQFTHRPSPKVVRAFHSFSGHFHSFRKLSCFLFLSLSQLAFRLGVLLPCFVPLRRGAPLFVQMPQGLFRFYFERSFVLQNSVVL